VREAHRPEVGCTLTSSGRGGRGGGGGELEGHGNEPNKLFLKHITPVEDGPGGKDLFGEIGGKDHRSSDWTSGDDLCVLPPNNLFLENGGSRTTIKANEPPQWEKARVSHSRGGSSGDNP